MHKHKGRQARIANKVRQGKAQMEAGKCKKATVLWLLPGLSNECLEYMPNYSRIEI
jgi:hypothetical protein